MFTLDGGHGEGGGQIVRTALALSALTGTPFRIENIRAGRDEPGLKAQHVACVRALERLCNAVAEGAEKGSQTLTFYPKTIKGGTIDVDIGTAGSITLLMQAVLLPAMFADKPTRLTIIGGTDVDFAMPVDYFSEVFAPHLKRWCDKFEIRLLKRGYVPAGGGKIELFIKPAIKRSAFASFSDFARAVRERMKPLDLTDQGQLMAIRGVSHASKDLEQARVAERQAHAAQAVLTKLNTDVKIRSEYADTLSTGSGITLWAVFSKSADDINVHAPIRLGSDALGKKGMPAETVGKSAAERLLDAISSKAPVDKHLADNLVPFLALAGGQLRAETVTDHAKTNATVVEQFLGTPFEIKETTITTTPQA